MKRLLPLLGIALASSAFLYPVLQSDDTDWPEYLGGPDRSHYSPLTQINTGNVGQLKQAWSYSAPDSGQMQVNSIIVGGVLYGVTATVQAFALDAATGKEIWRFGDPLKAWHSTSRGVAYWSKGADKRILYTVGPKLYALDAQTGKPIDSFGEGGSVDMRVSLGPEHASKFLISNTPGTVFEDLIVMPTRVDEGAGAAPGYVQAFDVRTGRVVWTFHTIPQPGEYGYDTWPKDLPDHPEIGGVNCWAGMAVDKQRGILFVPTGSASYDFYGANRLGQNLFANCLLALDARTGKRLWHYQTMHHDIWDRDLPSPPTLLTVTRGSKKIDAVAQTSKQGFVFIFDRVTGKPLFDIKEVPVAKSTIPGEVAWPTQPIPTKPAPFARQQMTEADINPYSTERDSLLARFRSVDNKPFTPISQRGTIFLPGCDGGAEWGGSAADPDGILYVNANDIAWLFTLKEKPKADQLAGLSPGHKIYTLSCASCHGSDRKGNPKSGFPSLVNINTKRDKAFVSQIITNGKGMMPGFTQLTADEKQALISFLFGDEKVEPGASTPGATNTAATGKPKFPPYSISGYNKFLDSKGAYAIKPPWGTLNAIDLNTGEYLWKIPLGEDPDLKAKGIPNTGTENYGGPVVTAGGLVFIAATKDEMFRAFDRKTGKLLWETKLPAAGYATPSTYQVGGKQYVVIACGGNKLGTKKGNQYVAFSL